MKPKNACPVCGSSQTHLFLVRDRVPVHQNLLMPDRQSALDIIRGDLRLAICLECAFVFNQTFELRKLQYSGAYDNTQSCSSFFKEHLRQLVDHLIYEKGMRNRNIVEVGCGKGEFLRALVEIEDAHNIGYGFDPSYVGPESDLQGRLNFVRKYYGPEHAQVKADAIICRHVIEHVPDPLRLLSTIRTALNSSPSAAVYFETPCVEWILRNKVLWDFFYEHCSLFTEHSLTTLFETAGFNVGSVTKMFGGQYLWLEASLAEGGSVSKAIDAMPLLAGEYAASEQALISKWRETVQKISVRGKVSIWGAGAKGVTFANIIDPEQKWIDSVIDLNPKKQKHFIPGTGHPIHSYQELPERGITDIILMNPNYHDEISELLAKSRISVNLIQ